MAKTKYIYNPDLTVDNQIQNKFSSSQNTDLRIKLQKLRNINFDFRYRLAFEYFVTLINNQRRQKFNLTKPLTTLPFVYQDGPYGVFNLEKQGVLFYHTNYTLLMTKIIMYSSLNQKLSY